MDEQNVSNKALNDVYKNAHIALQSISDILPSVEDKQLKAELKKQYNGYQKVMDEISAHTDKNNITLDDINVLKKAMLWSSIKMKTLMNDSRNNIAEMMIKGTVTGINELTAMKNEKQNLDEAATAFVDKLLSTEEDFHERLKKFL